MFYRVGTGVITNPELKDFVKSKSIRWYSKIRNKISRKAAPINIKDSNKIIVFGEEKEIIDYKLAKCCNPIPGDDIFGFTTVEEGIKIHRSNCPNAIQLRSNFDYRLISAFWIGKDSVDFIACLTLKGIDRIGLMNNVTKVISSQMNVNINAININSNDGTFEGKLTLKVHNVKFLKSLMKKLKKIDGIQSAERTYKLN